MKKLNFVSLLLCVFVVSFLAGCATPILKSSYRTKQYSARKPVKDYRSGAWWIRKPAPKANYKAKPVKDYRSGAWWIRKPAPKAKASTSDKTKTKKKAPKVKVNSIS